MFILSYIFDAFDFYWFIFEFSDSKNTLLLNLYSLTNVLWVASFFVSSALNSISTNMIAALVMSFKFLFCIALLIFARGGIPRFRFDYLTKLGWIRFLSLVLLAFLLEILIINTF